MYHSLFDIRTGYWVTTQEAGHFNSHPNGEGGECFFILEHDTPLPLQVIEPDANNGLSERQWLMKFNLDKLLDLLDYWVEDESLYNICDISDTDVLSWFTVGSNQDFAALEAEFDTRQNALLTVGTGYSYSTISAAHTASSSGDFIAVYATAGNVYTETVSITKTVIVQAMVPNHVLRIHTNSGTTVTMTTNPGANLRGFTITTSSATGVGLAIGNNGTTREPVVRDCRLINYSGDYGTTQGCQFPGAAASYSPIIQNSIISGFGTGIYCSVASRRGTAEHVTITDCISGVGGIAGGANTLYSCVLSNNIVSWDSSIDATYSRFVVTSSGTAIGIAGVAGFNTADLNSNGEIVAGSALSTAARLIGFPNTPLDGFGNYRMRMGAFYAGWHDPLPGTIPAVTTVQSGLTYGLNNELYGTLVTKDLTYAEEATRNTITADRVEDGWVYSSLGVAVEGTLSTSVPPANYVLTTTPVGSGNYIPISAESDVRWNVLYGLNQRGTLGAPPSGNSQGRMFFELLHNTIRDSGLLNAVLVSGTAADHVDFPRFHLGEPTANIYPTRLNQAPRIFLTPGDVVTLPSNNRSNIANATAEVDIVSLVRNNSEYLNALEFADSMSRYIAGPNCGGYWKSGSWTSGTMSISNIQVRQEKPQPMPNNCMSYRLNISADLRQVGY